MGPTFKGQEIYITTANGTTEPFYGISNMDFKTSERDCKKDAADCIANSNLSFSYELSDNDILSKTGFLDYHSLLDSIISQTPYTVHAVTMDSTGINAICEPEFMRKEFHMPNSTLQPHNIKTIGRKTFVEWSDGTTTKVTCDRDVTPDPFMAFCAAYTKKMFGSTTKILEAIDKADEKSKRKQERQHRREQNEHKRMIEKEKFDADVERRRYELAVEKRARMLEETKSKG